MIHTHTARYIFSDGHSLYFFLIFANLWWFGVGIMGRVFGDVDFQLMGLGACGVWCGASGFFGVWAFYIDIDE